MPQLLHNLPRSHRDHCPLAEDGRRADGGEELVVLRGNILGHHGVGQGIDRESHCDAVAISEGFPLPNEPLPTPREPRAGAWLPSFCPALQCAHVEPDS